MLSYAVLIDGGFIRKKLGSRASPLTAQSVEAFISWLELHSALKPHRLHRVYFYDAEPMKGKLQTPLQGDELDLSNSPAANNNRALHQGIVRVPFVSLRMGELAHNGWRLPRNMLKYDRSSTTISGSQLRPVIQQKGVDMRIGLDIAALTLKRHVQIIALVTGDSDFVPAMKFARREGAQLFLYTLGHGIKDEMREHSDIVVDDVVPGTGAQVNGLGVSVPHD
ncbi:MAG: NYN domain-containing protein [Burkholderiaceae bacterium]